MSDNLTAKQRRNCMAAVRHKNTRPEMLVRQMLHRLGYRFRLHRDDLPGKPDIVLPKYGTVIFCNGCFWHQHRGCRKAARPTTNVAFWAAKLDRTIERDRRVRRALRRDGWHVITVWECQMSDRSRLASRLTSRLTQVTAQEGTRP
jgi:DNA mismatch endonuclease (patch repair protein)